MDPILLILAAALSAGLVVYATGRRFKTTRYNQRGNTRAALREQLGLVELDDPTRPEGRKPLEGIVDHFPVRIDYIQHARPKYLKPDERSSHAVQLRVQLSEIFVGIEISAESRITRRTVRDVETGDEVTDHELLIQGPERQIVALMSAQRRLAFRQCIRDGFRIRGGNLEETLSDESSPDELVERTHAALRFARRIDSDTSIEGLLAENVLQEPLPSFRRRNATLLLTTSHTGQTSPEATQLATSLLGGSRESHAETDDLELKVRAAAFLGRASVLVDVLGLSSLEEVTARLALRGLVYTPRVDDPEGTLDIVIAALLRVPDASHQSLFKYASEAIERRLSSPLSAAQQAAIVTAIARCPAEASGPLCKLLGRLGTTDVVAQLQALPRSARYHALPAVRQIQERGGGDRGGLSVVDSDQVSGRLSSAGPEGDIPDAARGGLSPVEATSAWAVVPAKAFVNAKSRLSTVLDHDARAKLAAALLSRLLHELSHGGLAGIVVATASQEVADLASQFRVDVVEDGERLGVSQVVAGALQALTQRGATSAIVVMADLPLFDRADCRKMLAALEPGTVVVAPDRRDAGANAVAVSLPAPFELPFGREDSFAAHCRSAEASGLTVVKHESRGASLDLDTPEDLALWQLGDAGQPDA